MTDDQAKIIGKEIGRAIADKISSCLLADALKEVVKSMKNPYSGESLLYQLGYSIGRALKHEATA